MTRCIFANGNGQAGESVLSLCLQALGLTSMPISTAAAVGDVPAGRPAWDVEGYDPTTHVLTGVHWPGSIDMHRMRDEIFRPHRGPSRYGVGHLLHSRHA